MYRHSFLVISPKAIQYNYLQSTSIVVGIVSTLDGIWSMWEDVYEFYVNIISY